MIRQSSQRNYSTDFELDEFIKQNIKKKPFNKKKLFSLNNSFNSNLEKIKGLTRPARPSPAAPEEEETQR